MRCKQMNPNMISLSGIVSNIGQEPVATGEAMEFLVTGPMCRYVQDLTPMMKVLGASNSHMLTLDQKVRIIVLLDLLRKCVYILSSS